MSNQEYLNQEFYCPYARRYMTYETCAEYQLDDILIYCCGGGCHMEHKDEARHIYCHNID